MCWEVFKPFIVVVFVSFHTELYIKYTGAVYDQLSYNRALRQIIVSLKYVLYPIKLHFARHQYYNISRYLKKSWSFSGIEAKDPITFILLSHMPYSVAFLISNSEYLVNSPPFYSQHSYYFVWLHQWSNCICLSYSMNHHPVDGICLKITVPEYCYFSILMHTFSCYRLIPVPCYFILVFTA